MSTLKDQICTTTDELRVLKMAMGQGRASYDEAKAKAIELLTLRIQAEQRFGKVKTKITPQSIASLLR